MRKRFYWTTAAAGNRFPDFQGQGHGQPFNWMKVDNRGANPVNVHLDNAAANDQMLFVRQVGAGKCWVGNVAGPHDRADTGDGWPRDFSLLSVTGGTTVMVEIADHPITDLYFVT